VSVSSQPIYVFDHNIANVLRKRICAAAVFVFYGVVKDFVSRRPQNGREIVCVRSSVAVDSTEAADETEASQTNRSTIRDEENTRIIIERVDRLLDSRNSSWRRRERENRRSNCAAYCEL
jgi:hypothetical protein